jgi:poly(3-hydroxybutyrate) depolymerase
MVPLTLPKEALVLAPVGRYGRSVVPVDALAARLVAGKWLPPRAGDTLDVPGGPVRKWEPMKATTDGAFRHPALRGGYAYLAVQADQAQVMLLEAAGHATAYVNGEPHTGDTYQYGSVRLPIALRQGSNDLLFQVGRGDLRVKLTPAKAPAQLDLGDTTLPDLLVGEEVNTEAAVMVLNATAGPLDGLAVEATLAGSEPVQTVLPALLPASTRKLGFRLRGSTPKTAGTCTVALRLLRRQGEQWHTLDTAKLNLRVLRPEQTHKRTFRSAIDGSVQYYAVVPPATNGPKEKPGLVLTLHGAAVEGLGQAQSYAPKPGLYLVAPTNRRPYGFDWEEWGRLDALEVLALTQKEFGTDPRRTYLTGHSMGGHGTWHLGVTYPDRFAAIAPSAGWISMWSYAGARRPAHPDAVQEMVLRAAAPSDTLALAHNYTHHGVYILHGDRDDNVPVEQARNMVKRLSDFQRDFSYFEEPGAGHWWGKPGISGAACVDWPPIFEFFSRHTIPADADVRQVEFVTASPGVSAWSHWVGIEAQIHPLKLSTARVRYDPGQRRFVGMTTNVGRLALDLGHVKPGKPLKVELDGQTLADLAWPDSEKRLWFTRDGDKWTPSGRPAAALKGPRRYGPFKEAFGNRVQFVYGTTGTPEENAWSLARARYDAETFWYRGNGSVDVVSDVVFLRSAEPDRNVILYGHAQSNAAWEALLSKSPVQVRRGGVRLGGREESGDDLACLFVRPRPGSDVALVGVVAGTDLPGLRLTEHLPYFVSGVGYPDCLVLGSEALRQGWAGVRVAGFFGVDWGMGEFAWRQ